MISLVDLVTQFLYFISRGERTQERLLALIETPQQCRGKLGKIPRETNNDFQTSILTTKGEKEEGTGGEYRQ